MSDVSNSAHSESAHDVSNLTISNASAAGVQLPSFLYEHDTYTEDAPAYSALPYEEAQQAIAASQVNSTNEETPAAPPVASSAATATSMPLSTTFIHPPLGNVDGQPGQPAPPLDQLPIFSQLQAAQQASYTSGNASVYTFGRRLATCKFFRPTKGYGFLNDVKPSELGFQDIMVHATELYGPRNARIQSLARGELVEYTLVWAQHRGFYAVSVTGPGAVHVIGDPACNNGSIAYGRVSGPVPATARPALALSAAALAPIFGRNPRAPSPLSDIQTNGPPRYDQEREALNNTHSLPNSPFSNHFDPLPSPRSVVSPSLLSPPINRSFSPSIPPAGPPSHFGSPTFDQLLEANAQMQARIAALEARLGSTTLTTSSPLPSPMSNAAVSIWGPMAH